MNPRAPGYPGAASLAARLLVVLAALAAFHGALQGTFHFDDFIVLVDEPGVHSLRAWSQGLAGLRPLLKLSYALNWTASPEPAGFLAVNLALHLANAWMVHALLLAAGRRIGLDPGRGAFAAFGGALLFALHPVQVEAVAYVSSRSVTLSSTFLLAAALAYLKGREEGRRAWSELLSPGLFAAAVLCRETALVLPLALTVLEACGPAGSRRPLRGPWVHWALCAAGVAGMALHPGYRRFLEDCFAIRGPSAQLRAALEGLRHLASKALWPAALNVDPPLVAPARWSAGLAAALLALAATLAAGLGSLRRRPWLAFGLLWGLAFLLPTQGPVPRLDLAVERHLYMPLAGFGFVAAAALAALPARGALLGLVATALGVATVLRVRDFRDGVSLWTASLRVAPDNARAWNNLGVSWWLRDDPSEAGRAFRQALRLRPGWRLAEENLRSMEGRR